MSQLTVTLPDGSSRTVPVAPLARTFGLIMKRIVEPETIREVCVYRSTERALSPPAAGFADFLLPWLKRWDRETQADARARRG